MPLNYHATYNSGPLFIPNSSPFFMHSRRERLQLDFHAHDLRKDPGKKCLHQSQTEMETYKDFSLKPDLCLIKFFKGFGSYIYIYIFALFFSVSLNILLREKENWIYSLSNFRLLVFAPIRNFIFLFWILREKNY